MFGICVVDGCSADAAHWFDWPSSDPMPDKVGFSQGRIWSCEKHRKRVGKRWAEMLGGVK